MNRTIREIEKEKGTNEGNISTMSTAMVIMTNERNLQCKERKRRMNESEGVRAEKNEGVSCSYL